MSSSISIVNEYLQHNKYKPLAEIYSSEVRGISVYHSLSLTFELQMLALDKQLTFVTPYLPQKSKCKEFGYFMYLTFIQNINKSQLDIFPILLYKTISAQETLKNTSKSFVDTALSISERVAYLIENLEKIKIYYKFHDVSHEHFILSEKTGFLTFINSVPTFRLYVESSEEELSNPKLQAAVSFSKSPSTSNRSSSDSNSNSTTTISQNNSQSPSDSDLIDLLKEQNTRLMRTVAANERSISLASDKQKEIISSYESKIALLNRESGKSTTLLKMDIDSLNKSNDLLSNEVADLKKENLDLMRQVNDLKETNKFLTSQNSLLTTELDSKCSSSIEKFKFSIKDLEELSKVQDFYNMVFPNESKTLPNFIIKLLKTYLLFIDDDEEKKAVKDLFSTLDPL